MVALVVLVLQQNNNINLKGKKHVSFSIHTTINSSRHQYLDY